MKKVTEKQARAIWRKAGAVQIKLPKIAYSEAEKMGLEYWNEALEIAACIAEGMAIPGHAVQAPSCMAIAKEIRKQKAKVKRARAMVVNAPPVCRKCLRCHRGACA